MNYYLNPKVSKNTDTAIRFLKLATGKSISSIANEMLEDAIKLPKYQHLIDTNLLRVDRKLKEQRKLQLQQKIDQLYEEYVSI